MELSLQIKMNSKLYVRDPESSELGKNILRNGITMIHEIGFEEFTFKKLAQKITTTEASIYRYFENKHRLLTYIITWYWTWLEYMTLFHTNNLTDNKLKIRKIINLLTFNEEDQFVIEHIDKSILQSIAIAEGNKSYLTRHVNEDNKAMLFKPYKDLCHRIAEIFLAFHPGFPYPHSLASTLIETTHHQLFFKNNLPRLTDFKNDTNNTAIAEYLYQMVFSMLENQG